MNDNVCCGVAITPKSPTRPIKESLEIQKEEITSLYNDVERLIERLSDVILVSNAKVAGVATESLDQKEEFTALRRFIINNTSDIMVIHSKIIFLLDRLEL